MPSDVRLVLPRPQQHDKSSDGFSFPVALSDLAGLRRDDVVKSLGVGIGVVMHTHPYTADTGIATHTNS